VPRQVQRRGKAWRERSSLGRSEFRGHVPARVFRGAVFYVPRIVSASRGARRRLRSDRVAAVGHGPGAASGARDARSAGATSVRLSSTTPDTAGGGASSPALSVGDELLIIQMQDGTFTTTNGSSYGTVSSLSSAGLYEYVYISAVSGTTITIVGAGSGNGLLNSYHEAAASSSHGQEVYQIIRVPQYTTGTLTSNFHAAYWDGKTGGVAAVDMASLLTLGGASVYATGDGFRGGGLTDSGSTPSSVLNNDFLDSADMNGSSVPGFGSKGEGIFGTPANLFWYTSFSTPSTPGSPTVQNGETDGYPSGDMGMGAPGNAGGGGDDDDPAANDE